jgi:hypothetical protein
MFQDGPEELLGHLGGSPFVRIREIVARRRGGPTDAGKRPGVQLQRIANIVEPDAMRQLGVAQGYDVAPGRKSSRHLVHVRLPGELGDQKFGNPIVDLPQQVKLRTGWNVSILFFTPAVWQVYLKRSSFFIGFPMGWL